MKFVQIITEIFTFCANVSAKLLAIILSKYGVDTEPEICRAVIPEWGGGAAVPVPCTSWAVCSPGCPA